MYLFYNQTNFQVAKKIAPNHTQNKLVLNIPLMRDLTKVISILYYNTNEIYMSRLWFEPTTSCTTGEHSSKELAIRNIYMADPVFSAITHGLILEYSNAGNTFQLFLPKSHLQVTHLEYQTLVFESRRGHHCGET